MASQNNKQNERSMMSLLHRAIGQSPTYLNYAVWESTTHFRKAFKRPEFKKKLSTYPSSAVASPHLFQKVAVRGVCVA